MRVRVYTVTDPIFPMRSVLGGMLISDGQTCASRVDCNLAAALLSISGVFVSGNKRNNEEVYINHFHVPCPCPFERS